MVASAPSRTALVGADQGLLERLRAGDGASLADVVRRWSPAMLRLAKNFVSTPYVSGALDADTAAALAGHLTRCPRCARCVEQFRETIATLGAISSAYLSTQT